MFPFLLPFSMLSVPSDPQAPSSLHQDASSLQLLWLSASVVAPRAARLVKEVEKAAPEPSALTQSMAVLCKATSSTLQRGGDAAPPNHRGQHIFCSSGRSDGFLWAQASSSPR